MSNQIKKMHLIEWAKLHQVEICLKCLNLTEACECLPVTVGQVVSVHEWRRRQEGLGAVRVP